MRRDEPSQPADGSTDREESAAMTFEENLARLDDIVGQLDGDGMELDRALRLFEEGVERLRAATGELTRVEQQVKLLVEQGDGAFDLRPMDA